MPVVVMTEAKLVRELTKALETLHELNEIAHDLADRLDVLEDNLEWRRNDAEMLEDQKKAAEQ